MSTPRGVIHYTGTLALSGWNGSQASYSGHRSVCLFVEALVLIVVVLIVVGALIVGAILLAERLDLLWAALEQHSDDDPSDGFSEK